MTTISIHSSKGQRSFAFIRNNGTSSPIGVKEAKEMVKGWELIHSCVTGSFTAKTFQSPNN